MIPSLPNRQTLRAEWLVFFSVEPLCPTANFCTVRGVLWIPIRNKRGVQILLLAVAGISGCSSTARPYHSAAVSAAPVSSTVRELPVIADPAPSNAPTTPQIDIAIDVADASETITVPPMPLPQPAPPAPPVEMKTHGVEQLKKAAPTISSAANPIVIARPAENDNRLLEFLDKDIDKAIEQPKERRHLHFSKAVVEHPSVRQFVRQYSVTNKIYFETLLARSGRYMPIIAKVLSEEGLPEELAYLALLESEFQVNSTSPAGAVGLWQFVASTARQYGSAYRRLGRRTTRSGEVHQSRGRLFERFASATTAVGTW